MLCNIGSFWTSGITLYTASFFTNLQVCILESNISQCVLGIQGVCCIILVDELVLKQRTHLLTLYSTHKVGLLLLLFYRLPYP